MGLKTNYTEGDLILVRSVNDWSLGAPTANLAGSLNECPVPGSFQHRPQWESVTCFEGKLGLVVKVIRNRLEQPLGYRVQIGEYIMLCKSVIAEKYFEPVGETSDDIPRRTNKV